MPSGNDPERWKVVYYLSTADSSFHTYKITWHKSDSVLRMYNNDTLTYTYTGYYWNVKNESYDPKAFTIGNISAPARYCGEPGNVPTEFYTKGNIGRVKIIINDTLMVWNFKEGVGQNIYDSVTYSKCDRKYPDATNYCPGNVSYHLQNGIGPGIDTCDAVWFTKQSNPYTSKYSSIGNGFAYKTLSQNFLCESYGGEPSIWQGSLVIAGYFDRANGTYANPNNWDTVYNIARWDSTKWVRIGCGFNTLVYEAQTYGDTLVACGQFTTGRCGEGTYNYIAQFKPGASAWEPMGSGFSGGNEPFVMAVVQYGNKMIAGGKFTASGNLTVNKIAQWDGVNWDSLRSGITGGNVYCIIPYNINPWSAQTVLVVGGEFTNAGGIQTHSLATWDGSSWDTAVSSLKYGYILRLFVDSQNRLWAGGNFDTIGGISANNVAYYDGSWHALGTGTSGYTEDVTGFGELASSDPPKIVITGHFLYLNGVMTRNIAMWDGTEVCPMGYGLDMRPEGIRLFDNKFVVTGDFMTGDGIILNNVCFYTP
jgi:hypothetical protein